MRLTEEQFQARAFFTLLEVVRYSRESGIPGYTVRRWLHKANAVQVNEAGAKIVTRARLESGFPELLEGLRRCVVLGLGMRARRTRANNPNTRSLPHIHLSPPEKPRA